MFVGALRDEVHVELYSKIIFCFLFPRSPCVLSHPPAKVTRAFRLLHRLRVILCFVHIRARYTTRKSEGLLLFGFLTISLRELFALLDAGYVDCLGFALHFVSHVCVCVNNFSRGKVLTLANPTANPGTNRGTNTESEGFTATNPLAAVSRFPVFIFF